MESTLLPGVDRLASDGWASEALETDRAASVASSATLAKLEEQLQSAEARRQAGNTCFRSGDATAARKEYDRAVTSLAQDKFSEADEDLLARARACRIPAQLNLALCCLKADPPEGYRALELCEEVLQAEPDNAKATFRKGKALVELEELKEAEYEFVRAVKLTPSDMQIRKELEVLRGRLRAQKENEKRTYEAIMKNSPGFASDGRVGNSAQDRPKASAAEYAFLTAPEENPYAQHADPVAEARSLFNAGHLEHSLHAWEAAVQQSAAQGDWDLHFSCWLELAMLFMDLNVDALALRCLNKVVMNGGVCDGGQDEAAAAAPSPQTRTNALLLRAVCLLNEAEQDTLTEVSGCLSEWLDAQGVGPAPEEDHGPEGLDARVALWRESGGAETADSAVAVGLLDLLHGRDTCPQVFGLALLAPVDEDSCFGALWRRAARWNMLGAVLANRQRYENALVAYGEALKLQPHYPRALTNKGIAHKAHGDSTAAAACYAAALQLVPEWGTPPLWELTRNATQEFPAPDIAEAVEGKSLVGLQRALGPDVTVMKATEAPDLQARQVLTGLGLLQPAEQ